MTQAVHGEMFGPGATLGPYVIERLAFEGGFASLYEAHNEDTGEKAAIKVLRQALAQSDKMLARFEREAQAIRGLEHPGIVELYAVGELDDGRPYIAMQWLPGRNLLEELRARGPLTQREALSVAEEIGVALDAAHAVGIVHRDLKAQNVMAVPDGDWFRVVVVDFGIAKVRGPEGQFASLTTQTILGTPQTAAPEQIMGDEVDARTDVYALGLLVYQMVTGRLPFDAPTVVELEELHLHAPRPRASEIAAVSAAVDRLIQRAMAVHKEDRFGSAGVFVEALRDASLPESSTAPAVTHDTQRGIGLWITTQSQEDSDRSLRAMDSILAVAEREIAGSSLKLALDTPSALLAVGNATPALREAVRCMAQTIRAAMAGIEGASAINLRIAVHVDQLVTVSGELIGGSLLSPGAWPPEAFLPETDS